METDSDERDEDGAFPRIRVGISSCLLGQEVRFDGGHKRDSYINGTLAEYFEFVPFCPEMAVGLGVPRQPIRLVTGGDTPRVVGVRDPQLDVTEALHAYGRHIGDSVKDISGYILKRGSPSCGMERVKVYSDSGMPVAQASGAYARALMEAQPLLPVEEEGRLGDAVLRENFIGRVFAFHRWQRLLADGLTPQGLVDFHAEHKLLLMAHSQDVYRQLGRLVAGAGTQPLDELAMAYVAGFMEALRKRVRRGQHVNVLQHLMGYLKTWLDAGDKAELLESFEAYRKGYLPLIVPITLLKHHFRRHPHPYVQRQRYLSPHPGELMLRNLL